MNFDIGSRQARVGELLLQGLTDEEIAEKLGILVPQVRLAVSLLPGHEGRVELIFAHIDTLLADGELPYSAFAREAKTIEWHNLNTRKKMFPALRLWDNKRRGIYDHRAFDRLFHQLNLDQRMLKYYRVYYMAWRFGVAACGPAQVQYYHLLRQGMSASEIARSLDQPYTTVRALLTHLCKAVDKQEFEAVLDYIDEEDIPEQEYAEACAMIGQLSPIEAKIVAIYLQQWRHYSAHKHDEDGTTPPDLQSVADAMEWERKLVKSRFGNALTRLHGKSWTRLLRAYALATEAAVLGL